MAWLPLFSGTNSEERGPSPQLSPGGSTTSCSKSSPPPRLAFPVAPALQVREESALSLALRFAEREELRMMAPSLMPEPGVEADGGVV